MLQITIPEQEFYNERTGEFIYTKTRTLNLEHSLVSLSKWESKWNKPFLTYESKTREEFKDYVRCMTLTQNISSEVYDLLTPNNIKEIEEYMNEKMTATWFSDPPNAKKQRKSKSVVTSEIIYYWMISYGIPMECQKWHLNRLMTLIRVFEIKSQPQKKMTRKEQNAYCRNLNAARKAQLNTRG